MAAAAAMSASSFPSLAVKTMDELVVADAREREEYLRVSMEEAAGFEKEAAVSKELREEEELQTMGSVLLLLLASAYSNRRRVEATPSPSLSRLVLLLLSLLLPPTGVISKGRRAFMEARGGETCVPTGVIMTPAPCATLSNASVGEWDWSLVPSLRCMLEKSIGRDDRC